MTLTCVQGEARAHINVKIPFHFARQRSCALHIYEINTFFICETSNTTPVLGQVILPLLRLAISVNAYKEFTIELQKRSTFC